MITTPLTYFTSPSFLLRKSDLPFPPFFWRKIKETLSPSHLFRVGAGVTTFGNKSREHVKGHVLEKLHFTQKRDICDTCQM